MNEILNKVNFLDQFPGHILVAGRFKENKIGNKTNIKHNISLLSAEMLNDVKDKWDIFFTPNGDFKDFFGDQESKDQKGRSAPTVERIGGNIYYFIADNDLGEKIRKELGLTPTIVVKTLHGYHMYFKLKNPVSYKEYAERFREVETKFETLLHADPKCKDIARILRVPGFRYWADNLGETIIEVEEYNSGEEYSFDEWEEKINAIYNNTCYDDKDRQKLKKQFRGKRIKELLDDAFNNIKNNVSALDVLEDLYPQFEGQKSGEIYENGKRTSGYKRSQTGNYVNNFSTDDKEDRPRGGPRHIAFMHYKSVENVLEYFEKMWNIKIDDFRKELGSEKEISFQETKLIPGDKKKGIVPFGNKVEGILLDSNKKEIRGYNADSSDIPFIKAMIVPVGKTKIAETEKYIIKIEKESGEFITLLPISGTITEFRRFLQSYGIMVQDKSKFFTILYEYIYSVKREYLYTNKLGLQILGGKKIIVSKTGTYVNEEDGVYVSIEDTGNEFIDVSEENTDIKKYVEQLIGGYDGQVSLPIFLTLLLGVNCFFFRENYLQLPQAFMFGLSQSGKALKGSTEIPMSNGDFMQIKNIKEGDSIIGGNGLPTTVIGKYNPQQNETYRVSFNDGSSVDCCADHLREVWNIYRTRKDVLSTTQLIQGGVMHGKHSRYAIDLSSIEYAEKKYTIDPYTLGVRLGGGCSDDSKIWIKHGDEGIIDNIKEAIHFVADESGCARYWMDGLNPKLRELNLFKNKHIPNEYLTGSREQRLELLAGLLDTDGTVGLSGNTDVSFSTSIEQLALNMKQLIMSLGWTCNIRTRIPKYTYKGIKKEGKKSYTIEFYPDVLVFKLERQNKKIKLKRDNYRRYIRSITKIEKEEEYYCIQVNSEDRTFMCTRDYIKTHNTTLLNLMFKSFGIVKDVSALSKAFIYEKYAKHYLPTHFSEYRNSGHKQADQIEGLMRNLFDGTPIEKGRADQSTIKYESNGLYIFDGQTIFTDDAVQTRMIILMANKRYMGPLSNLERLPNIYKAATNIFSDDKDFKGFIALARRTQDELRQRIKLYRSNDRMLMNYSYLYALLDRLDMKQYYKYIDKALIEQDGLTAQDDIQFIYQKIFNLQVINKFDTTIYKKGIMINMVEESMKANIDVKDLKGFIQTINANFLGANQLIGLSAYIDLEYVYTHPALHGAFFRMLDFVNVEGAGKTEEEHGTIGSLRAFLQEKCPAHSMIQGINFEANLLSKQGGGERTQNERNSIV